MGTEFKGRRKFGTGYITVISKPIFHLQYPWFLKELRHFLVGLNQNEGPKIYCVTALEEQGQIGIFQRDSWSSPRQNIPIKRYVSCKCGSVDLLILFSNQLLC